jgi:hypothetical protein
MIGWIKRKLRNRAIKLVVEGILRSGKVKFLQGLIGSKKIGALVLGVLAVVLREVLGLDEGTIAAIVALVSSYILGQSAVDFSLARTK